MRAGRDGACCAGVEVTRGAADVLGAVVLRAIGDEATAGADGAEPDMPRGGATPSMPVAPGPTRPRCAGGAACQAGVALGVSC